MNEKRYAEPPPPAASPRLVYLASPFRGATPELAARNVAYADRAMADSLARGEAPFVPHLLYTRVLRDEVLAERVASMKAAAAYISVVERVVAYTDLGTSPGMASEIELAAELGVTVEYRELGTAWAWTPSIGPMHQMYRQPPPRTSCLFPLPRARRVLGTPTLFGVRLLDEDFKPDDRSED